MSSTPRNRGLKRNALAVALGVLLAGSAIAAETGGLRIAITDTNGKPVANATVNVSSPDSLVSKSATTDAAGNVRIQGLDPATNYTVEVVASGFDKFSKGDVAVISGKNLSVGYSLGVSTLDTVVVTGTSLAAVDTTSPTVSTTLTLDTVESLPTGRSYQSYLQLVPGVKPSSSGNPSSKSGVNYSDIGGVAGTSTDNLYYLDGVDVTDHQTGTFGANFNSEIIQEQQVLTGGVPAEYAGGSGLISKVVTKSGSDEFHGSINYYLQNDSLVADDKHGESAGFSTYDTAVTIGGPIIKEKLWFFGSYQIKNREDDVTIPVANEARTVVADQDLAFFKATWQATDSDRLTATFFNDPYERDGSSTATTLNARSVARKQGGDNYKIEYSHDWDNMRIEAYGLRHEGEVSDFAANSIARNNVAFRRPSTIVEQQQGGAGSNIITERNRDEFGISGEYWLDTDFGSHAFKAGFSASDNNYFEDLTYSSADRAQYTSIGAEFAGVTYAQYTSSGWSGTRSITATDTTRILNAMAASANSAYFLGLLDADHNDSISATELGAMQFSGTAGNPTGQVNSYRIVQSTVAPYDVGSEGRTFYLQDTWTMDQWTVNAGIRAEEWQHYDSAGRELFTFDWELAPRVSVVYDLAGDGRSKVWGFWGRYYDPVRTNISDFAGNLTGSVFDEQVYIGNQWLTFRTRGGPVTPDAVFAPATETPYTDEFLLGYATTFGEDLSLSVSYTSRRTRNLLEDYDLHLYSDPTTPTGDEDYFGYAGPGSAFYLPYSYFGFDGVPNANYVIGTLAGGKREYQGLEVTLTKQRSDNWMGQMSYTFNDAKGNSNSDSNADFQGDWVALDPRAPNIWGPQAGNIKHQFKAYGTYYWENGFDLSGVFNWNSGLLYSSTFAAYGRHLPDMSDGYEFGGVYDSWVLPNSVGAYEAPSYFTFDMRAKYSRELSFGEIEVFLDVFNVLDKQSTTTVQDLSNGGSGYDFGEGMNWVAPRRAYLGVRYQF